MYALAPRSNVECSSHVVSICLALLPRYHCSRSSKVSFLAIHLEETSSTKSLYTTHRILKGFLCSSELDQGHHVAEQFFDKFRIFGKMTNKHEYAFVFSGWSRKWIYNLHAAALKRLVNIRKILHGSEKYGLCGFLFQAWNALTTILAPALSHLGTEVILRNSPTGFRNFLRIGERGARKSFSTCGTEDVDVTTRSHSSQVTSFNASLRFHTTPSW